MPELVIGNTHVLEFQARKRADSDPVGASVDVAIRFLKLGHADHGKYWDGNSWEAAAVVAATPLSFHAQQYALSLGAIAADMRGGWITLRVADADAVQVGEEIQYPIVLYALDAVLGLLGEHQITVHVQDADTNDLYKVNISIYTEDNATFVTSGLTDSGGDKAFALTAGTYKVRLSLGLYGFTVPETMVVTTDATKTFTGTAFSAPTPSAPDYCSLYGTLRDAAGNAIVGAMVSIYATVPQGVAAIQVGDRIAKAITNSSGYFTVEIQKSTEVMVEVPDVGIKKILTVPNAVNQDISTWTTW